MSWEKNKTADLVSVGEVAAGGICEPSTNTHNLCTHPQGRHQSTDESVHTQSAVHFKPIVFQFLMLQWLKMIFNVH